MRQQISPARRALIRSRRVNATDAERRLWAMLRGKKLDGLKFRRQAPFRGYILDFVCFRARLVVEADGGQHSGSSRDAARDAILAAEGFSTLHLWNSEILGNPEGTRAEILRVAREQVAKLAGNPLSCDF